jgi:hypothetical protein
VTGDEVIEHLLRALNSNPSTAKKTNEQTKQKSKIEKKK